MRANASFPTILLFLLISLIGCTPETETFQTEPFADYLPLKTGKYIIYRLDSTVYTENGRKEEVHSYQEKDVIDAEFLDNSGRTSYRVFRSIRDLAGAGSWKPISTYIITPGKSTVEMIEDNMRILQLAAPIKEKSSWKGNQFLAEEPYKIIYDFENDRYIKDWQFTIDRTGETVVINGKSIPEVITVTRVNERDIPDTVTVNNNLVNIRANDTSVWIRGTASGAITMNVANPTIKNFKMAVYNNSNFAALLNTISTPPQMSRVFEYVDGAWVFGSKDDVGNRIDRVSPDLPSASKNYGMDRYAKNIGLVEQELILWEFQPNQNGSGTSYKVGFGVKRTMVEHN